MKKTRVDKYSNFSSRVENMFKEKVIQLKKLGFIEELELVGIAGLLAVQKKN